MKSGIYLAVAMFQEGEDITRRVGMIAPENVTDVKVESYGCL